MTLINEYSNAYLTEQIQRFGAQNLSDKELLYYVLSQTTNQKQAKQGVNNYFAQHTNLGQFRELFKGEWVLLFAKQACFLEVLVEFSKRINSLRPLNLGQIYSSQEIGEHMAKELGNLQQEVLVCLYLDTKNQILAQETLFKGTLNSATVHPREIFKEALRHAAARFMVIHNHRETCL
ncbi:JAB domain-containing protein [Ligilactobacillus sp. Marseille-Q7487]|jgi:DNA repair protein RadC|uniref:JAB domain-containing protein n=1 Tax=Ligilactobacillus sp. Marseille-Q7487 TaxID=3022128 RepID=UPI0015B66815|nr:JAB domain-containing protein [Ligilactobacillus sp. Marseille-Q7487]